MQEEYEAHRQQPSYLPNLSSHIHPREEKLNCPNPQPQNFVIGPTTAVIFSDNSCVNTYVVHCGSLASSRAAVVDSDASKVDTLGVAVSGRRPDGYIFMEKDSAFVEATAAESSDVAEEGAYVTFTLVVVDMEDVCVPPTSGIWKTTL